MADEYDISCKLNGEWTDVFNPMVKKDGAWESVSMDEVKEMFDGGRRFNYGGNRYINPYSGYAYVVFGDDGVMHIIRSNTSYAMDTSHYQSGWYGTFTDIYGRTYTGRLWDAGETSTDAYSHWWSGQYQYKYITTEITKVVFDCRVKMNSMKNFFYSLYNTTLFSSVKSIEKMYNLDTSNCTSFYAAFYKMTSLEEVDVSRLDTSNATDFAYMFSGCESLNNIDVSGFNTSNVTNMQSMFQNCYAVTALDVSGFNTSNVTNMSYMFYCCYAVNALDVSGFDTSKVTDMSYMFSSCYAVTALDVSGFDTSKVKTFAFMFNSCKVVTALDVSGFNTSLATSLHCMFQSCYVLPSIDLSSANTSNVTNMRYVFYNCYKLQNIYVGSGWSTSSVTDSTNMFVNCSKLPNYSSSYVDKTRAYYGGDGLGYLTYKS